MQDETADNARERPGALSHADLTHFREHGWVRVPGVFGTAEIERLLSAVERYLAAQPLNAGERTTTFVAPDGTLAPRKLAAPFYLDAEFQRIVLDPRLTGAIAALGDGEPLLLMDHVFLKPPRQAQIKHPHQDNSYFRISPAGRVVSGWIALDDADLDNGCLFYLDGSQRLGLLAHTAPADEPRNFKADEAAIAGLSRSYVPARRGDVIFHHSQVVHGSGPNRSEIWRRGYATHWLAAPAHVPEELLRTAVFARPDYPGREAYRRRYPELFPPNAS